MKNKGIYYTLAIIIVAGITITTCTDYFLRGSLSSKPEASYELSAQQEQDPVFGSDGGGLSEGTAEEGAASGDTDAGTAEPEIAMALAEDYTVSPDAGAGGAEAESGVQSRKAVVTESAVTSGELEGSQNSGDAVLQSSSFAVKSSDGAGTGTGEESISISPLETAAADTYLSSAPQSGNGADTAAAPVSYYRERLLELDAQIQKNRENQSASNVNASAKNAASSELKLWDNELNLVYNEIMDRLNETQAAILVKEEREWIKERDRLAAEAAKASSSGSLESVEYTVSLAETTRMRAYELVDDYEYLLMD